MRKRGVVLNPARALQAGFALLLLLISTAAADLITKTEPVSDSRSVPEYTHDGKKYGPYGWNFSYTRIFDGTKVEKDVEINFSFDPALGWTAGQQTAYRNTVEAAIEGQWNNRYALRDLDTGKTYPLTVDVTYTGPFNQDVTVWKKGNGDPNSPDPKRTDMKNWHQEDTGLVNSHEFGHMLGLYDEYWGGAVASPPVIDDAAVMGNGCLKPTATMPERYYQQYLDFVKKWNPSADLALEAVPEPATLLILGGGLLALHRRRRRAAA